MSDRPTAQEFISEVPIALVAQLFPDIATRDLGKFRHIVFNPNLLSPSVAQAILETGEKK